MFKSVLSNRGLGIMAKKCLYEGVILPTDKSYAVLRGFCREVAHKRINVQPEHCE